jgi:hypothetical protein
MGRAVRSLQMPMRLGSMVVFDLVTMTSITRDMGIESLSDSVLCVFGIPGAFPRNSPRIAITQTRDRGVRLKSWAADAQSNWVRRQRGLTCYSARELHCLTATLRFNLAEITGSCDRAAELD